MNAITKPSLDAYWDTLSKALPVLSESEQRVAIALYRELAKGVPVGAEDLGAALNISTAEAREALGTDALGALVYLDDNDRVIGFGGLAVKPMHHRFEVDGQELWTWCAWDTLFIPGLLGKSARVESPDPSSGEIVRLNVFPDGIETADPEDAVVSFLLPAANDFRESAANVMGNFCHFVFFFESEASADRWTAEHEGTFWLSLAEATELARRLNAKTFGHGLANH